MIYMEPRQLGARPLVDSFVTRLGSPESGFPHDQLHTVVELFDWLLPPMIDFAMTNVRRRMLPCDSQHQTLHFLRLFGALVVEMLGIASERQHSHVGAHGETHESQPVHETHYQIYSQGLFLFALVSAYGASLDTPTRPHFDTFMRELLLGHLPDYPKPKHCKVNKNNIFPERGSVFDYYFECDGGGHWLAWSHLVASGIDIDSDAKLSDILVPTAESARLRYFLDLHLRNEQPTLVVGPTGTGKTAIINAFLLSPSALEHDKYITNSIGFSARTSAAQTQDLIMSKLERKRKGVYGPSGVGKCCLVFVDDLNMPAKERYGAQPPIELLRQWLDHRHWYDHKDTSRIDLVDLELVCGMSPPLGGRNEISARFARHCNVLGVDTFDDATLTRIFSTVSDWHFGKRGFEWDVVKPMSTKIVWATLALYKLALRRFLPTPSKSHYVFNLRDFARVMQGVMLIQPGELSLEPNDKLTRLWVHEAYRVFADRLVDDVDRVEFFNCMGTIVQDVYRSDFSRLFSHLSHESDQALSASLRQSQRRVS